MRSPAATRLLALPRFFRFFTGLPPLVGLCGASVMCETNCFSVGNMLKSVPYSLITNCTVSTPMASIPVRSTPLMRYSAAAAVPKIVETVRLFGSRVPIIGDFHYNGHILLKKYPECARALAKYRINPGNSDIGRKTDDNFRTMIEVAVENHKPVRIGVNWGSLDQQLLTRIDRKSTRLNSSHLGIS